MTSDFTYRNLPQLLLQARERLLCNFRPLITQFNVTEQQWRIIRAISEAGQLEPHEIGATCQILSPSLAGILSRMEKLDLIKRSSVQTDQRRRIVRLTPKSEKIISELAPLINQQYKLISDKLGDKLMQETYDIIDKILMYSSKKTNKKI